MSPGIPPSPDQVERQRVMVLGTLAILSVFFLTMYLTVFRPASLDGKLPADTTDPDARISSYLAEEERASAYAALRSHLDQRKGEDDIAAVYCRDCSHRWIDDVIEFQGEVDFERPSGTLDRYQYVATLRGSKAAGWTVLSVETTPGAR
jgi:hypothetical protein